MDISINGAVIHYEIVGSGQPMLIIHGLALDHSMMKACMEPVFAARPEDSWKRIYIDLPGMGGSRAPESSASSDCILAVLLDFIDAVIPGQDFALAGESYGGYLARGILRKRTGSVRGLLLLCPVIAAEKEKRTLPEPTIVARDEALMEELTCKQRKAFETDMVMQTRETWARYQREIFPLFALGDRAFQKRLYEPDNYPLSFDVDSLDAPFEGPTLILLGRQDKVVGWHDAWRLMGSYPRAAFAVLDRTGHNLQIEQEGLFAALAGEWLHRVRETG